MARILPAELRHAFLKGTLCVETQANYAPLLASNLIELGLVRDWSEAMKRNWKRVNPSGGAWDGHPLDGGSLLRMAECVQRLNQDPQLQWGLCHSLGGPGTTAAVVLLERELTKRSARRICSPARLPQRRVARSAHGAQDIESAAVLHRRGVLLCLVRYERFVDLEDPGEAEIVNLGLLEQWLNGRHPAHRVVHGAPREARVFALGLVERPDGARLWALAGNSDAAALSPESVRREEPTVNLVPISANTTESRYKFVLAPTLPRDALQTAGEPDIADR